MTSPVGRVPLTDEQASSIADMCERSGGYCGQQLLEQLRLRAAQAQVDAEVAGEAEEIIGNLHAELANLRAELSVLRPALRAARGRIDKALAAAEKQPIGSPGYRAAAYVSIVHAVRAALTGTEDTDGAS